MKKTKKCLQNGSLTIDVSLYKTYNHYPPLKHHCLLAHFKFINLYSRYPSNSQIYGGGGHTFTITQVKVWMKWNSQRLKAT